MSRRKPFFILSEDDFDYVVDILDRALVEDSGLQTCKAFVRSALRRLEEINEE